MIILRSFTLARFFHVLLQRPDPAGEDRHHERSTSQRSISAVQHTAGERDGRTIRRRARSLARLRRARVLRRRHCRHRPAHDREAGRINTSPHAATAVAAAVSGGGDRQAMLAALDRLIDTGPEFDGFLTNHGPMAADAMIRLGGGSDVERWVGLYRMQLGPAIEPGRAIDESNWRESLGKYEMIGDWIGYFHCRAATTSWPDLLAEWWPRLLPGAAAGATHGLIRTAHAVRLIAEAK